MSEQVAKTQPDLLDLIRSAMKNPKKPTGQLNAKSTTGTKPNQPQKGRGAQRVAAKGTRTQPRQDEHGKLGDFSRSNSNPTSSSVPTTTAPVGFEDVSDRGDESLLAIIRINLANTGRAPSKRAVKHMAAPKMTRPDRVFGPNKGCGPGSSKHPVVDMIKAINAKETGCIVRKQQIPLTTSQKNANTTQGGYYPQIVEEN